MLTTIGGFAALKLANGLMREYDDGNFTTSVFGFLPNSKLMLPGGYTHFGVVVSGEIELSCSQRIRRLGEGDFFSVRGCSSIESFSGTGMVSSAYGYNGLNVFGGPLEEKGRLRYIDGCSDTLLIPPVRKGDPCLNHLHFPSGIVQTPHVHPSVRTGIVFRGEGECILPEPNRAVPLVPGYAFVIETNAVHSFNTRGSTMDIVAFHPDSDTGMTDDDHPMINRTMVQGVSARHLNQIRTKE